MTTTLFLALLSLGVLRRAHQIRRLHQRDRQDLHHAMEWPVPFPSSDFLTTPAGPQICLYKQTDSRWSCAAAHAWWERQERHPKNVRLDRNIKCTSQVMQHLVVFANFGVPCNDHAYRCMCTLISDQIRTQFANTCAKTIITHTFKNCIYSCIMRL